MDEHIDPALVRGLLREEPKLNILEARLTLGGTPDDELIKWATENGYLLVTRDVNTLIGQAYRRIQANEPTCGVLTLRPEASLGVLVRELLLIARASRVEEWSNQVVYVPFK